MSAAHPEEDLIDYEEDDTTTTTTTAAPATGNGSAAAAGAAATGAGAGEQKEQKGSYVGIHSTGFRDFLLKPELLRAISDLGFEHPSEGECRCKRTSGSEWASTTGKGACERSEQASSPSAGQAGDRSARQASERSEPICLERAGACLQRSTDCREQASCPKAPC